MRRLRSEAAGMSYVSTGDVDAPSVVCLHGFPDIPRTWGPLTNTLVGAGFRVMSPWLPGYAPSSLEGPLDPPAVVRRLLTLIGEVSPDAPVRIVGHDWGAVLTHAALSQRPERFRAAAILSIPHPLVLERNVVELPRQSLRSSYMALFQLPVIPEKLIRARDFAFIEWLWKVWSPGFSPGADYFDELKQCLRASMPAPLSYYRSLRSPKVIRELRAILQSDPISVPSLYLHGERDRCIGVELMNGQERYFSALFEAVRLTETGHFVHLERPAEVNRAIVDWFLAH
ncbi:MAG: alpha/beta hydrolase [Myxococcales bacterium]|nr:alpha/beta hydrolase [Myxococcales bacterium]